MLRAWMLVSLCHSAQGLSGRQFTAVRTQQARLSFTCRSLGSWSELTPPTRPPDQLKASMPKASHGARESDGVWDYSQLSLLTGFPGPVLASEPRVKRRKDSKVPLREPDEQLALQFYGQEVQPVFRASPFPAEELRRMAKRQAVRILLLDEGNCCRSVIAEAMIVKLLEKLRMSGKPLDVHVESASLGPSFEAHDPRVERLAREAGLKLTPRRLRCFDETRDMVDFDLILVMDKFDFDEVLREVSVLDTINPGGFYSARVQQFGHFAAAGTYFRPEKAPWVHGEGIADPLYGNYGGDKEQAALWGCLRKLRLACAGLAQYLSQLQTRCVAGTSLQQALATALLCPLLDPEPTKSGHVSDGCSIHAHAWAAPEKGDSWRPVWRSSEADAGGQLFSLRTLNGSSHIVKRPDPYYKVQRGYWRDIENLRKEIEGWTDLHGTDRGRLPTDRELRKSGANHICNAIQSHGGYFAVAEKLGLKTVQKTKRGQWSDREMLQQELVAFVEERCAKTPRAGKMPAIHELKAGGRSDLAYAVSKWGGIAPAAELCGFSLESSRWKSPQAPRSDSESGSLLRARDLLVQRFPERLRQGRMPSRTELLDSGQKQLAREITDLGGFKAVSAELGLEYVRARRNTSKQAQAGQLRERSSCQVT